MRKKLTATICVFSGFLICVSMLISSVLAATTATATITASVTYTPAIQAKIWLNDGSKDYLIFNNADKQTLASGVSMNDGTISISNYSAESGTTFTFKVANCSPNGQTILFGLELLSETKLANANDVIVEEDFYEIQNFVPLEGNTKQYRYNNTVGTNGYLTAQTVPQNEPLPIANATAVMSVTPLIVVPTTIEFNMILFGTSAS